MKSDPGCIFCQIVKGAVPATIVERHPHMLAIRDVNPQAPDHLLVFSADHVESLDACDDTDLLGQLLFLARDVARRVHIDHGGYRVVLNQGDHGGQTVPHLHLHVLGGRRMKWPPG